MTDGTLYMWTVYDHPYDIPDSYVARKWAVNGSAPTPTDEVIVAETLDTLREFLADRGLTPIERSPEDDPMIVETWL